MFSPQGITPSRSLVDLLRQRAQEQSTEQAYTFLDDAGREAGQWTAAQLDRRARVIAAHLQERGLAGERAILMYPPGLEYIAAFFGCLYAGVVAVPAYPVSRAQRGSRLQSIVADASPRAVLSTTELLTDWQNRSGVQLDPRRAFFFATDQLDDSAAGDWHQPPVKADDLAFLQYTSGSTSTPRGVMVSHENLLHNLALTQRAFGLTSESRSVIWLPPYHDMGLIGGILQPLFAGFPVVLMAPMTFLRNPLIWLEALSRYEATTSGGPNFAYELCVSRTTAQERAALDLSRWDVAFNGSEPIRAETLERFAEAFAPAGFRREAFYSCYGLAEATLFVTGGMKALPPVERRVSRESLEQNCGRAAGENQGSQTLISSGRPALGQDVVIVDPQSRTHCDDGTIGEIWVTSSSVAQGYWQKPEKNAEIFQARMADTDEGPYLRTGDLGFLADGELFVSGRLKDLIVIRGRNLYPQDIERTVERSHAGLQPGCGAAVSVERGGEEQLVIVHEVQRQARHGNLDEIAAAAQRQVASEHGVTAYEILLLTPGSIPRTSSGKIQRHACRDGYRNRTLPVLHARFVPATQEQHAARQQVAAASGPRNQQTVQTDLRHCIGELLGMSSDYVDLQSSLNALGLDSLMAMDLKLYIQQRYNVDIHAGEFIEDVTIEEVALRILVEPAVV